MISEFGHALSVVRRVVEEEERKEKSASETTFHRLLRQLGEEHDRELAHASRGFRSEKSDENSHNHQVATPGSREVAITVPTPPILTRRSSSRLGKVKETHESKAFMSAAHAMVRIHTEALSATRCVELAELPRDHIKLHSEWLIDTEEKKLDSAESWGGSLPKITLKDSVKGTRLESPTVVRLLGNWKLKLEHSSWLQMAWDLLGVICITFDLCWIPVQIGFEAVASKQVETLEWIVRVFWTADLLVRALKMIFGDERSGSWCKRCRISLRFLFFDSIVVLADWMPLLLSTEAGSKSGSAEAFGLLRIGKIPRILRILRIVRLARIVKLEDLLLALRDHLLVSSESMSLTLNMFKNMLAILVCCHVSACIWFYIGNNASDEGWVEAYSLAGPEVPLQDKYLWSFHWVASQWTPASMEVSPHNIGERYFNVLLLVIGVMTFSTFMGAITASLTRLRSLSGFELSQFFLLRRYLHENAISRSLTVRISRYIDLALEMHRKRIHHEDVSYLKLLSGPLKIELQKEIYLPHLCRLGLFADYNDWDPDAMSQLCFVACARSSVAKGDVLFSLGSESRRMYCAVTGTFIYQRRRGLRLHRRASRPKKLVRVGTNVWCCESSLWVRWHHYGSMCALVDCEVVEVDAQKFRDVTSSRSSVYSRSVNYAKDYAMSMCDEHGYAWDVPNALLYPESDSDSFGHVFWWQREVVDAEMKEAKWWAAIDDSGSDVAMDDEDDDICLSPIREDVSMIQEESVPHQEVSTQNVLVEGEEPAMADHPDDHPVIMLGSERIVKEDSCVSHAQL